MTPDFPHFYYMLGRVGANLGPLLYREVSVIGIHVPDKKLE